MPAAVTIRPRPAGPAPLPTDAVHPGGGLFLAVVAAICFSSSGVFASALQATGWSPAATALVRTAGGAVALALPAWRALAGRWHLLRLGWRRIMLFGALSIAGGQLCFFHAVNHLPVGLALLIEYLAPVVLVGLTWLLRGTRPGRRTVLGVLLSVTGLALVLDLTGAGRADPIGVVWALCATAGLVLYFVVASDDRDGLPSLVLVAGGMAVATATLGVVAATGVFPAVWHTAPVTIGGARWPWWTAAAGLAGPASGLAYTLGAVSTLRLGSKVASFVGLSEVLFATGLALVVLGQLPGPLQLAGGVLIVAGAVAVKLEGRPPSDPSSDSWMLPPG